MLPTSRSFAGALAPALVMIAVSAQPAPAQGKAQARAVSCSICHPGALKSLERSRHAKLFAEKREAACLDCHTGGLAHAKRPEPGKQRPKAGTTSCTDCHAPGSVRKDEGRMLSHPTRASAKRLADELAVERLLKATSEKSEEEARSLVWEGFLRAGWRFVQVNGNEALFDQDVGLDEGPRLSDLQFSVKRPGEESIVRGEAYGLEDKLFETELETGRGLSEDFGGKARFSKRRTLFAAGGDFHRLSRDSLDTSVSAFWDKDDDGRLELSYSRRNVDGTTLTSRIGNPGQVPLDPVQNVPADLSFDDDLWSLAWESKGLGSAWSVDLGWARHKQREGLSYARPSPANPGFTESEFSESTISQSGPELSASILFGDDAPDSTRLLIAGTGRYLESVYGEAGTLTAFDTSAFTTETTGHGTGTARHLALDTELDIALDGDRTRLILSAAAQDLKEHTLMALDDRTVRGALVTLTPTRLDFLVRRRAYDTELLATHTFKGDVDVEAGYRYLFEHLEVPDLEPGDANFSSGDLATFGPVAGVLVRPDENYRISLRYDYADRSGITPTRTQPDLGQSLKLKVRRKLENDGYAELFTSYIDQSNSVSSTDREVQTYGGTLGMTPYESASLRASVRWSKIVATSLSTFFYAPSVTPVPTTVGYRGETLLGDFEFETKIGPRLRSVSRFAIQHTTGSLPAQFVQAEQDVRYQVQERFDVGVEFQYFDYNEPNVAGDEYDAYVTMLYVVFRF